MIEVFSAEDITGLLRHNTQGNR